MGLRELKDLVKKFGSILIMNGSVPEFVLMTFDSYKKLEGEAEGRNFAFKPDNSRELASEDDSNDTREIERLNREILALKEEIRQKEESEILETETEKAKPEIATEPNIVGKEELE